MSDYDDPSPSDAQLITQRETIAALDPLAQGVGLDRPGYDTLDQGDDGGLGHMTLDAGGKLSFGSQTRRNAGTASQR